MAGDAQEQIRDDGTAEAAEQLQDDLEKPQAVETAEPSGDGDGEELPESAKAAREAAKYRRQLREVEQERDQLRSTVEGLQRLAVEGSLPSHVNGRALWSRTELAAVVAEDGSIDPEKLDAAVADVEAAYGLSPRTPVGVRASMGRRQPSGSAGPSGREKMARVFSGESV